MFAENIQMQQWRQIKRYFKLSMGIKENRGGLAGYNLCVKYDYMYHCLVHNMNYVMEQAGKDNTMDGTTWGFSGYSAEAS
jgi:hypothetical protein